MSKYPDVKLFIAGEWRDGQEGKTLPIIDPATEEEIGRLAHATKPDLDAALEAAERGFKVWRDTSAFERYKILRKAADILRERKDDIGWLMTREQGKPLNQSSLEVAAAADTIDWIAEEGRRTYGRVIPARGTGVTNMTLKLPVGPVAAFTPWNFPINQIVRKLCSALATGCSIIVKAPEETPASPAELIRAFTDAGVPTDVMNLGLRGAGGDIRISDPASDDPQDFVHRLDAGRQAPRGTGRPAYEAGHHGTRRSCAGPGVRRRGCRQGSQADGRLQDPQRGAGLHLADPLPGAG